MHNLQGEVDTRFREELVLNIQAPREAVWAAFQDFWSKAIKEVSRVGSAWRFWARGQPPVDLIWVAEATERRPPEYLAFQSAPGVPHNLEILGWLRLSEAEDGDDPLRGGQVPVFGAGRCPCTKGVPTWSS